ncbi:chemotaxis protein CheW [Pseudotabrizicola sediminis]|uniref:Chemotaxis protein CheW n=1 Tax=Pseudotabrizicola sediminis TaxID=2486418 RepID=A0ABY2KPG2_9RHOB|nr:chemotaxis protein CheW [Pseudotabrizicola sediminis]TGD43012.1 chemotaxis protein CheW [Pseudotabrizicola sediminis]TGD66206.1 chemotaxis protein CheW [Tabrizicola sp. WMC-M-20]
MRSSGFATDPDIRELVAFRTAGQDFCIDILSVREIRGWSRPALLPHAPSYVQGVINLRGAVVPILDLARRLGLEPIEDKDRNVIIVAAIQNRTVGLLVEAVTDILGVPASGIQPTPDLASEATRSMLRGVVVQDSRLIRLLDVAQLLPPADDAAA